MICGNFKHAKQNSITLYVYLSKNKFGLSSPKFRSNQVEQSLAKGKVLKKEQAELSCANLMINQAQFSKT